ncbi:hypothetical protein ACHQM5_019714 [Ranunculus cassubicifolius]
MVACSIAPKPAPVGDDDDEPATLCLTKCKLKVFMCLAECGLEKSNALTCALECSVEILRCVPHCTGYTDIPPSRHTCFHHYYKKLRTEETTSK